PPARRSDQCADQPRMGAGNRARVHAVRAGGRPVTVRALGARTAPPEPPAGIQIGPRDRLLVLAPHPDDETLGTGGLLSRAARLAIATEVVFVTDGDDNPWPQRVLERRIRLDAGARARWAERRRFEAVAALDA